MSSDAAGLPEGLVTPEFQPRASWELPWLVLEIPEDVIGLAFAPIGLAVQAIEATRADKPFRGAKLQSHGFLLKYAPKLSYAELDGFGFGASLAARGGPLPVTLGGVAVVRLNGDFAIDAQAARTLGELENRVARVKLAIDHDDHQRFYGLGATSDRDARNALLVHQQVVAAEADLQPDTWYYFSGSVQLGLVRQDLEAGAASIAPPVTAASGPAGFGETTTYGELAALGRSDSRDTQGRPAKGLLVEVGADVRADVQGRDLAGATFHADLTKYLTVLPEGRVLVLAVGAAAAVPLYPDARIPFSSLPVLGRGARLRGYDRDRFRDRYAGWVSAEYRWPIFEVSQAKLFLDAFAFAEGAALAGEDELSMQSLHYSAGGGVRFAHETASIAELTIGGSPEGAQVMFATTFSR